jgi:hypothetical protein
MKAIVLAACAGLVSCASSTRDSAFAGDAFRELSCPEGTTHVVDSLAESCVDSHGSREGPYVEWERPGERKIAGTYKNGKRQGPWVLWYANGSKAWERVYDNGGLLSEETYYEDGRAFSVVSAEKPSEGPGSFDEGFPKAVIGRVINAKRDSIRRCFTKELESSPGLSGMMAVQFTISPLGQVEDPDLAASTIESSPVEECVIRLIAKLEFPRPKGGGVVRVKYPFSFPPVDMAPQPRMASP